jgi:hypothetical protein
MKFRIMLKAEYGRSQSFCEHSRKIRNKSKGNSKKQHDLNENEYRIIKVYGIGITNPINLALRFFLLQKFSLLRCVTVVVGDPM